MRLAVQEVLAVLSTLAVLAGLPLVVWAYQESRAPDSARLIELTGVMKDGVWTDETVNASNFPFRSFRPAEIVVKVGEPVVLRLTSADVTHSFYVPELGIGPIEVYPGHVVDVPFEAEHPGNFTYYCTLVCGDCHHFMRGTFRVVGSDGETDVGTDQGYPDASETSSCPVHEEEVRLASLSARGAYLFRAKGCVSCHGKGGQGGIDNPNYIKGDVPALDALAEKMFLFEKEDCDAVVDLIEEGADLASLTEEPPFPRYGVFLAQYNAVRDLIRNGNPAGKKDPNGPIPPLHMPAWDNHLSTDDIDAIIVYLLEQFEWDDEE